MIIIPIGVDCGNADFLRKNNLRELAFPFDWVVTYDGVSNIIKNNFANYIPNNSEIYNSNYNTSFPHNIFPNDNDKMIKRINRFKNILETSTEKIIFIRKGHAIHNHKEQNNDIIKSDIIDAEDLDIILQEKYPNLNYEIIVTLICGKCFNSNEIYTTNAKKIKIYNISMQTINDNIYNNLCLEIFNIAK